MKGFFALVLLVMPVSAIGQTFAVHCVGQSETTNDKTKRKEAREWAQTIIIDPEKNDVSWFSEVSGAVRPYCLDGGRTCETEIMPYLITVSSTGRVSGSIFLMLDRRTGSIWTNEWIGDENRKANGRCETTAVPAPDYSQNKF